MPGNSCVFDTLVHVLQVDYMELPLPIKYEEIQREAVSACPWALKEGEKPP
jgi:hypothetical protein